MAEEDGKVTETYWIDSLASLHVAGDLYNFLECDLRYLPTFKALARLSS